MIDMPLTNEHSYMKENNPVEHHIISTTSNNTCIETTKNTSLWLQFYASSCIEALVQSSVDCVVFLEIEPHINI